MIKLRRHSIINWHKLYRATQHFHASTISRSRKVCWGEGTDPCVQGEICYIKFVKLCCSAEITSGPTVAQVLLPVLFQSHLFTLPKGNRPTGSRISPQFRIDTHQWLKTCWLSHKEETMDTVRVTKWLSTDHTRHSKPQHCCQLTIQGTPSPKKPTSSNASQTR